MTQQASKTTEALANALSRALDRGMQVVEHEGEQFVVLTKRDFELLTGAKTTFKEWLLEGPHLRADELPPRNGAPMRELEL